MSGEAGDRESGRQQIVVGGVGGQGVLFVTRLLAEAAIRKGAGVLTSETHGMAQRGGVVVSHLKVGDFASPLVRSGRAEGLIALSADILPLHLPFLAPGGWTVVNAPPGTPAGKIAGGRAVDADALAREIGNPRAVNLVLLGFVLSLPGDREGGGLLFCSPGEVRAALEARAGGRKEHLETSLAALDLGMRTGSR